MRSVPLCLLCVLLLPACAGSAEFRELKVTGFAAGDIYRQIERFAQTRGLRPDPLETDTGRRIFVSKWRGSTGAFGRAARRRLHAEVVAAQDAWLVRYFVEMQTVSDFTKAHNPAEEDWTYAGQDTEMEKRFRYVMSRALEVDDLN